MKIFYVFIFLLSPVVVQAQTWSVGARSGVGFWHGEEWSTQTYAIQKKAGTTTWEKEVYLRYQGKKHLSFEAGLSHNYEDFQGVSYGWCPVGVNGYQLIDQRTRYDYYGLNLRVQYRLGWPFIKGLSHNPGIAVAPSLLTSRTRDIYYSPASESYNTIPWTSSPRIDLQIAVEDMIIYQLTKHVDVHSLLGYRLNGGGMLLQKGFTLQAGVSYRF